MAYDRHILFCGALAGVILLACIAGLAVAGGPGKARKEREDSARLNAVTETARALACYSQAMGSIPDDLSLVEAALADATSDTRSQQACTHAELRRDPVTDAPFPLRRDAAGTVTHICANFATADAASDRYKYAPFDTVIPDINKPREKAGEHCFALNLDAKLD